MAIIYSYPTGTVQGTDMVIGSDPTVVGNPTKNFRIGDISTFVKNDILGYTAYASILTQVGAAAPTEVLLKNGIAATMAWTYAPAAGPLNDRYIITASAPVFILNKTFVMGNNGLNQNTNEWRWWRDSDTQLTVDTGGNSSITDGAFEIRIYS